MDGAKKIIERNWSSIAQVAAVALLFAFLYAMLSATTSPKEYSGYALNKILNESSKAKKILENCTPIFKIDATATYAYYLKIDAFGRVEESTYERVFGGTEREGEIRMLTKITSKSANTTLAENLDEITLECKSIEVEIASPQYAPLRQTASCASAPPQPFSFLCQELLKPGNSEQVETFAGNFTATAWKNAETNLTVWKAEGVPVPIKVDMNASVEWLLAEYERQ